MFEGDKEGWVLIGVEGDARTLLKFALECDDPAPGVSSSGSSPRASSDSELSFLKRKG
jgi:hypothetical protein